MSYDRKLFNRRKILLAGVSVAGSSAALFAYEGIYSDKSRNVDLDAASIPSNDEPPLISGGIVVAAAICNDINVKVSRPVPGEAWLQTNGAVLCLDLTMDKSTPDLSKIVLTIIENGHDKNGNVAQHARTVGVQSELHGPTGTFDLVDGGPKRLLLVLTDLIYNQNEQWRSSILQIQFLAGWLPDRPAEAISGAAVTRLDTLAYPPFPVRPVTAPFTRLAVGDVLPFEVTGMHDWGRNGGMFACVEAWAVVAGVRGVVARSSEMVASLETPAVGTPSELPAPVYRVMVSAAGLGEGAGEIQYRVLPHIGPPWSSEDNGETFPTLNAPKGVPFCNDLSGSWAPVYGVVSQTGIGSAGTDTRGMAFSIEAAIASGFVYKDCAAVAVATKLVNAARTLVPTASGMVQRTIPHNDIAGGCAVLRDITGSTVGQNYGAYLLRTGFSSPTAFPPGATCFEIRSESGSPSPSVRLRSVDTNGTAMASSSKAVPSRLVLRGLWLDGTNTVSAQNTIIDGTAAAGAATNPPNINSCAYLISIDCTITENSTAGSAAPARFRAGYMWDVRVKTEGHSGSQAGGNVAAYAGLVASVGCSYAAETPGSRFILAGMFGVKLTNLGVDDRVSNIYPAPSGRLMINVRIDFEKAFTSPAIMLCGLRPSVGGLGLGNVFCRGIVDSGGPLISIGADGTMFEIDNIIMRHIGADIPAVSRPNNGRANILYQDQGYTRVNKIGTISFCALRSYNCKGDSFPALQKASTISKAWIAGQPYPVGSIVHDNAGASNSTSCFYQAIAKTPAKPGDQPAGLSNAAVWMKIGNVFNSPYGEQPLRQGNLRFRYHVGCHGNVASCTFDGSNSPSLTSGYGIAWQRDESFGANYDRLYRNQLANDYRPNTVGSDALVTPLLNRVPAGEACLPFDLVGTMRLNDGSGAAGAYERT